MPEREHTSKHYEQLLRLLKDKLLLMSHQAEYFLSQFASAEGKKGGQFYTPRSVVRVLVEMLAPYKGRVFDPCCGSGGMFVQSEKFVEAHGGRIGDIAVNIAERACELIQEPELKKLIALPIMSESAQRILKESLDAFVNSDADLAEKVVKQDKDIDDQYEQIFRELLTYMIEDTRNISRAIKLIFIAKSLERVGDHASNIAEMVVFMVKGQDIRHGTRADRR